MRILYVSTEVHPALKTGGLADVNAALPAALIGLGQDVRLLLPGFAPLRDAARRLRPVVTFPGAFGLAQVPLLEGTLGDVPVYLIDVPAFYARSGSPYVDADGVDWPDNAQRFALLGQVAARFADGAVDGWRPDIVHGHDWHAGLAPAYLAARGGDRPASVHTVHNLAYQGQFPAATFAALGLPPHFFAPEGVEFHGRVNFLKAGLHYADRITTVSPTYAREIQTPAFGFGLDGLLRARAGALAGILNGVDAAEWNPATDRHIAAPYSRADLAGKQRCAAALRTEFGLRADARGPLFAVVSRLTPQKGLDLVLSALPQIVAEDGQLALLGAGDADLEQAFAQAARRHVGAVAVRSGYDEPLAHRIVAGADVILVPSRFEPCGLTQMYGMTYGTLPLVRRVGGLADTVRDASPTALANGTATGFSFDEATPAALRQALARAFTLWHDQAQWDAVRALAMGQDWSWAAAAGQYMNVYRELRPHA